MSIGTFGLSAIASAIIGLGGNSSISAGSGGPTNALLLESSDFILLEDDTYLIQE